MFKRFLILFVVQATRQGSKADEKAFQSFVAKYKKVYSSDSEREYRKSIYLQSRARLETLRDKLKRKVAELFRIGKYVKTSRVGESMFDDLTLEEINERYLTPTDVLMNTHSVAERIISLSGGQIKHFFKDLRRRDVRKVNKSFLVNLVNQFKGRKLAFTPAPAPVVDWRNYTLPVRYQENCSACYAFSAITLIETAYWIQSGQSIHLSVEEIVRCSLGTSRCRAGRLEAVFDYIIENGITYEHYLTYTYGAKGKCDSVRTPQYLSYYAPRRHATDEVVVPGKRKKKAKAAAPRSPPKDIKKAEARPIVPAKELFESPKAPPIPPGQPKRYRSSMQIRVHGQELFAPIHEQRWNNIPIKFFPQRNLLNFSHQNFPDAFTWETLNGYHSPKFRLGPYPRLMPAKNSLNFSPQMVDGGRFANVKSEERPKFRQLINYGYIEPGIENLISVVEDMPVSVLFYASEAFQKMEKGSVYTGEDCPPDATANHSFVVIGYNLLAETPYFIIKNSWGDLWNEDGYAKIAIGERGRGQFGICGIARHRNAIAFPVFEVPEGATDDFITVQHKWRNPFVEPANNSY